MGDQMFDDLSKRVQDIHGLHREVEDRAKKFKESINKDYKELDQLLSKLKSRDKDIKQLKSVLSEQNSTNYKALKQQLLEEEKAIKKLYDQLAPRTGSLFVRLFLGRVNVKHYRDGERFRLKEEYQKFKRKTDLLFLAFVLFQIFVASNTITRIMFQSWLLYYYSTLALRENILRVNGSNIRAWWIHHHYLSIGVCLAFLTWYPESKYYQRFEPQFLWFSLFQGLVQLLQSKYQSAKLYKLIAMGHASTMDVSGETLLKVEQGSTRFDFTPSMTVLLPFLLYVQCFQIYNAFTLMHLGFVEMYQIDWQVPVCGVLFLALGFGNLATTLDTYIDKIRGR